VTEDQFLDPQAFVASHFYQEHYVPVDAPFAITGSAPSAGEDTFVLAVQRGQRQGLADAAAVDAFAALAPHVWSALALQRRLEDAAAKGALWSCEATRSAALLVDRGRRVLGASAAAERLVSRADGLRIRRGAIEAVRGEPQRELEAAVAEACAPRSWRTPPCRRILLASSPAPLQVTVRPFAPLPDQPPVASRALLLLEEQWGPRPLHPLTPAEQAVLELLLAGLTSEEICRRRKVGHETVRQQLKTLYSKFEVHGRAQLIARHLRRPGREEVA
jgi:DNA-binding CsgD family transcriptional regulator